MIDADFQEDTWPRTADTALEDPPALPDDAFVRLDFLDEGGDDNVRSSAAKAEIEALAASIAHRGLLQPLVVASVDGRFKVGAGNRRLKALKLLAKRGTIRKDHPVRVKFAAAQDLHEISLTENVMRVQLHPVDEFEAFRDLRDAGLGVPAIADRFGLKEKQVRQRLALGGLAPEVRKAWRDGRIGQEQAEAFTVSDDHDVQRQALEAGLKNKHHWAEWEVARILRGAREAATSATMLFVGKDAYLAAGGALREDLFGDVVLIEDPEILAKLKAAKLERVRQDLIAQGWSFAELRADIERPWDWPDLPVERWATDEEKARLSAAGGRGYEARRELMRRLMELPEVRAASGVIMGLNGKGEVELDVMKLRPAAQSDQDAGDDDEFGDDEFGDDHDDDHDDAAGDDVGDNDTAVAASSPDQPGPALPKHLVEDLTEQLGDVIAECFVRDPDLALRAAIAGMTSSRWGSPLRLNADGSPRRKVYSEAGFAKRFGELAGLDREQLMAALATALAQAIETRSSQEIQDQKLDSGRRALIAAIAPEDFRDVLAKTFRPGDFFTAAPGAVAKAAAEEAGAGAIKGKKAELADRATEIAQSTGWLPAPLRTVHYQAPAAPGGAA